MVKKKILGYTYKVNDEDTEYKLDVAKITVILMHYVLYSYLCFFPDMSKYKEGQIKTLNN